MGNSGGLSDAVQQQTVRLVSSEGGKQFLGGSVAIVTGGIVGIFPVEIVTGEQVCLGHGRGGKQDPELAGNHRACRIGGGGTEIVDFFEVGYGNSGVGKSPTPTVPTVTSLSQAMEGVTSVPRSSSPQRIVSLGSVRRFVVAYRSRRLYPRVCCVALICPRPAGTTSWAKALGLIRPSAKRVDRVSYGCVSLSSVGSYYDL